MNSEPSKESCKNCSGLVKTEGNEFCSSKCKNSYEKGIAMRHVHKINANKKILMKFESDNIKAVSRKDLLDEGFDFDYYSKYNNDIVLTDKMYFFEYGLEILGFNRYKIIKGNMSKT